MKGNCLDDLINYLRDFDQEFCLDLSLFYISGAANSNDETDSADKLDKLGVTAARAPMSRISNISALYVRP
jgi:hypothetical protein